MRDEPYDMISSSNSTGLNLNKQTLAKIWLSEVVSTFVLVFSGAVAKILVDDIGKLGVSLVHGMSLFVAQTIGSEISGGHANPVISFAHYLCDKITLSHALSRIFAQFIASIFAAIFITIFFHQEMSSLGAPRISEQTSYHAAIIYEITYSTILVLASLRCSPIFKPFSCAFILAIANINGSDISNGALNPARAFGTLILMGDFGNLLFYLTVPMIGAILGGLLQHLLYLNLPKTIDIPGV